MLTQYRHLAIDDYAGPVDDDVFAELEKLIGVPLPQEFVNFLKVAHGGSMDFYQIDVPTEEAEEAGPVGFSAIYRLNGERTHQNLFYEIEQERANKQIPKEVVPFASDGGGSTVYLDLTPEGAGRIVAFVEGLPEWAGKRQKSQFVEVAASFSEYVDKLYVDEDEIRDELEETLDDDTEQAWKQWLEIAFPDWRTRFADLIE
jgi:cell wall assembly regulator SMI1